MYIKIIWWIVGVIALGFIISNIEFTRWTDIEQVRLKNIDTYSKIINGIQAELETKRQEIVVLERQESLVVECLKLNSVEWIATDCDLYFNKSKNGKEERVTEVGTGSASGSDADKIAE